MPAGAGVIVAAHGRHYVVETGPGALVRCVPRGKRSVYACGDRVSFAPAGRDAGVIESVATRSSLFLRAAPHRQKLIAANATQVAVVVAAEPSYSDELVCRILVAAESQGIPALVVLNKIDLAELAQAARERLAPLAQAGYPVTEVSAMGDLAPLAGRLANETTVLLGQSGMGKSTIVNALVPGVAARTQEISRFLDSGRHTTTSTRLYRLPGGGALVDSPGLQGFGLAHLTPAQIEHAFPELRPLAGACRFSDCRHRAEPGCAVRAAAAEGRVHPRRLALLHRILAAEAAAAG